jgi:Alpha galactosidase C-terminal beta sandwich domain
LNHIVSYLMPGEGIEVGEPMSVQEAQTKRPPGVVATARSREEPLAGFGATAAEARTLVTLVALTGVAYPLASVMPELPEDRMRLLQQTLPTMPILPLDLFSRGTDMRWDLFKHTQSDYYIHNYPEILDLKVNAKSGVYDVVGCTNWRSERAARHIDFGDKLGLSAGSYVVFDYWEQKPLGVFENGLDIEIEPHDTRVLLIHPLLGRPQLVAISRHITGAYSVLDVSWDGAKNALRGSCQTVQGDPYAMWFYVPGTAQVSRTQAVTEGGQNVPIRQQADGDALVVSFPGQGQPVNWELDFANR